MHATLEIVALRSSPEVVAALADLLVETVAARGSVSFMHPLAPEVAAAFWTTSLAAADEGGRVVLGAMEDGELVGTVTLLLDSPPNQPHHGRPRRPEMLGRVELVNGRYAASTSAIAIHTMLRRPIRALFAEQLPYELTSAVPDTMRSTRVVVNTRR